MRTWTRTCGTYIYIVREMEAAKPPTATAAAPTAPALPTAAQIGGGQSQSGRFIPEEQGELRKATNGEGWDEIYAQLRVLRWTVLPLWITPCSALCARRKGLRRKGGPRLEDKLYREVVDKSHYEQLD